MNLMETTTRFWLLNNNGKLIWSALFSSIEAAHAAAKDWNVDETRPGMRVDVIQNARCAAEATRIAGHYSRSPRKGAP